MSGLPVTPEPEVTGTSRTSRLGTALALVAGLSYCSFLLAGAFAPQALAQPAVGSIPWSFLLGAGLLVGAVAITGLYVLVTNAGEGP
jgi:uncharacterized membrane protein (DUF485 family)